MNEEEKVEFIVPNVAARTTEELKLAFGIICKKYRIAVAKETEEEFAEKLCWKVDYLRDFEAGRAKIDADKIADLQRVSALQNEAILALYKWTIYDIHKEQEDNAGISENSL